MTIPREPEPQPELTTSPVRGGASKWLVAVIAVAVLGGAIYIGINGKGTSPAPGSAPAPIVAVASQSTPPAQEGVPELNASTDRVSALGQPTARPHTYLAVRLSIDGQPTLAVLTEQTPKELHAAYRIALPARATSAQLQLIDVIDDKPGLAPYGDWNVSIGTFHGGGDLDLIVDSFAPTVLVSYQQSPDPSASPSASPLSIDGYTIQVTGQRHQDTETLSVDVALGHGRERGLPHTPPCGGVD